MTRGCHFSNPKLKPVRRLIPCLLYLASCGPLKPGMDPAASSVIGTLGSTVDCATLGAPMPPSHLDTVSIASHRVVLSWWASPSQELAGYLVFRNGQLIAVVAAQGPRGEPVRFTDDAVVPASLYTYSIAAKGLCHKVSAHSQDLVVGTPAN